MGVLVRNRKVVVRNRRVVRGLCPACCGSVCCPDRPYTWSRNRVVFSAAGSHVREGDPVALPGYAGTDTFNIVDRVIDLGASTCGSTIFTSGGPAPSPFVRMLEVSEAWPAPDRQLRYGHLSGGFGGQMPRGGVLDLRGFGVNPLLIGQPGVRFRWALEPGLYGLTGWAMGMGASTASGFQLTGTAGSATPILVAGCSLVAGYQGGGWSVVRRDVLGGSGMVDTFTLATFRIEFSIACCGIGGDSAPENLDPMLDALA